MSDTKPVTLHDGTPVPQKWCAWWQCLCAGGDSLSRREVALKYAIEELARAEAREKRLRDALERLRDCDWVISLPDRMDAVREIARAALSDK